MKHRHLQFWPKGLATSLTVPETTLYDNLEVSTRRYPNKTAIYFYGTKISYQRLYHEVNRLAGFFQRAGIAKGDRILLYMQNSPQFIIAFHAIVRVGAVVVPINPMNKKGELRGYLQDCEPRLAVVGQELFQEIAPLVEGTTLERVVVSTYSDYLEKETDLKVPDISKAPRAVFDAEFVTPWLNALSYDESLETCEGSPEDMAVLPYTSGTTGKPKGCIHTHDTVQANVAGITYWMGVTPDSAALATLPLFHVTGMVHSMLAPIFSGSTIVLMTRWDRDSAGQLIDRCGCTHWTNIATMVIDFLANPNLSEYNLETLGSISGGGAPLPKAVGEKLYELTDVRYAEGYGLSETISHTHFNPLNRPKLQCMGVPSFDVDSRIINPDTLEECGPNEEGEVVVNGPQVFKGYWNRSEETEKSFITMDGKSFFRTGDIAKYDEEGYYFIVDRVKRMINVSGFKVWPTEVESILYQHPAVEQACVIGVPDERRGETPKAFIVLNEKDRGSVTKEDIIHWSKEQMAAYKYPRYVDFLEELPMSGSGKILWRKLQEWEREKAQQGGV